MIDQQMVRPAGKALNVSTALAWMGCASIAAGLWGRDDYEPIQRAVASVSPLIDLQMTLVEGGTRRNITVVDTLAKREMHLRCPSGLADADSVARLTADLAKIVHKGDTCVLAGAMPAGNLLESVIDLARCCHDRGGHVVADSHGPVLARLVTEGLPWLIAPNVEELRGLLDCDLPDAPAELAMAARGLLDKVPMVLVSRGENGAMVVTKEGAWKARTTTQGIVLSTVGCGDYLLAGLLAALARGEEKPEVLVAAIEAATARAWGRTETDPWSQIHASVDVAVEPI